MAAQGVVYAFCITFQVLKAFRACRVEVTLVDRRHCATSLIVMYDLLADPTSLTSINEEYGVTRLNPGGTTL